MGKPLLAKCHELLKKESLTTGNQLFKSHFGA
jgi:hypothetical protein